jgi:hypothetical protein
MLGAARAHGAPLVWLDASDGVAGKRIIAKD